MEREKERKRRGVRSCLRKGKTLVGGGGGKKKLFHFLSRRPSPNTKKLSLPLTLPLVVVHGPQSLLFEHTCSQIQGYLSASAAKNEQSRYATSGVRPPVPAAAGPNFTWSSSKQYSFSESQTPSFM